METCRIKKALAILLAVMFLLTVTVGAASAWGCGGWGGCYIPKLPASSANTHTGSFVPATPYFRQETTDTAVSNDPAKFSTYIKIVPG